ncbi:MAG: 1-deoxy-D-xylulose-5-phosphate reductoisomerase [Gammaproteobacteria bacterium]|nr:1-deoxy-D-xylulose-5-phosphate reductoisomerase [Gammaproteobacteria bacterium]
MSAQVQGVCVLGSTGSIGVSTLDVLARHPQRYRLFALSANAAVDKLEQQCRQFRPRYAVMADAASAEQLSARLAGEGIEVLAGNAGLEFIAAHADAPIVMAAIVGAAGLLPALAAVRAGKRLLLANKEALVVAGQLFMDEARRHGAEVLPIDSEHNAVFQCLPQTATDLAGQGVERILLTASGGPFRGCSAEQLQQVTPEQACAHPNWAMGRKISVDSATLMNKGLEVIEACWLFNARPEQIEVVVHPQSVIHSLVQYVDGSVLAQLGNPDMRTPIAHALAWPERIPSGVAPLDLFTVARLDFQPPDFAAFPCLRLAYAAIEQGGGAPAVLNAANEAAVAAFLDRRLSFSAIPRIIQQVMEQMGQQAAKGLDELLALDAESRQRAEKLIFRR